MKKRILVVDDDLDLGDMLVQTLKFLGYETVYAPSGAEALEIIIGHAGLDCIITDVRMPALDGVQLASSLSEMGYKAPIVFMSGALGRYTVSDLKAFSPWLLDKPMAIADIKKVMDQVFASVPVAA